MSNSTISTNKCLSKEECQEAGSGGSSIFQLLPELRGLIINRLRLNDALQLRLTCKTLNADVEAFYDSFQMELCSDKLTQSQCEFIGRIKLQQITFKRVAKPINSREDDPWEAGDQDKPTISGKRSTTTKQVFQGPSHYRQVGGIQIRRLSAPFTYLNTTGAGEPRKVFDFEKLRLYLLRIGNDDVFNHIVLACNH